MCHTGDDRHGFRLRAMIVVLWRGGTPTRVSPRMEAVA
jgi:hypothetical protein